VEISLKITITLENVKTEGKMRLRWKATFFALVVAAIILLLSPIMKSYWDSIKESVEGRGAIIEDFRKEIEFKKEIEILDR